MPKLTVDGKPVEVKEGETVLQAAQKLGIYCPTFCWHEKLEPIGACRICLVEIEKSPKLAVSCITKAMEGMNVHVNSPKAIDGRKGVMEMLLVNHPLDCPTCDKGGECDLQDVAFYVKNDRSRFGEPKRRFLTSSGSTFDEKQIGPLMYLTMNRCIACFKCVRMLKEVAGEYDLGAFGRGVFTEIDVAQGQPITNEFSGNTVEICPVGCLTSKPFRYAVRTWLTQKKSSVCGFCSDGCNLTLWVGGDKIFRATSRRNDAVDEGWICDKGRYGYDIVNHPDRVKTPLIRKNGKLEPATWEEAFDLISSKIKETKEKFGSDSMAGIGSARCSNEDNYLFQKFFRTVIGTNNIDHRVAFKRLLPSPSSSSIENLHTMTNSIEELEKTKMIVVIGCDITSEHPIIGLRIKKAVNNYATPLVLINSKKTKLNAWAKTEVLPKFGTEVVLINALCNAVSNQKADETFKNWVKAYSPQKVSETTGVDAGTISKLAEEINSAESCIFLLGREVINHPQNQELIDAVYNLAYLTGALTKPHSGVNLLWEYNNSQGALDMGVLPDRLPGLIPLNQADYVQNVEKVWQGKISSKAGLNTHQILNGIDKGGIKFLYVMGENLVANYPDRKYAQAVLAKAAFSVVQEIFLSETAQLASVVLPAASFAEKEGTFTSVERRVQKFQRGVRPLHQSKPDWQIISMLALWMDYENFNYDSAEKISTEIFSLVPSYLGLDFKKLGNLGVQWNGFLSKKESLTYSLKKVDSKPLQAEPEYPFILTTGNLAHHCGSLSGYSENLKLVVKEGFCEMNQKDAEKLGIKSNDEIWLESAAGKIKTKARLSNNLQPRTVFVPINFKELEVNLLMNKDRLIDWVKISKV